MSFTNYTIDRILEILPKNNTDIFVPTKDYNPATKKYVDDALAAGGSGNATQIFNTLADMLVGASTIKAGEHALVTADTDPTKNGEYIALKDAPTLIADWTHVTGMVKPHNHVETDVTDLDKYTKAEVDSSLLLKAEKIHTHVETDITDLDKYTQAEVDTSLLLKAEKVHTHLEAQITDLDKYTKAEVDAKITSSPSSESPVIQKTADFTVAVADGYDVWYDINTNAVIVTIPTGLPKKFRFTVNGTANTTFVTTGNTIDLPAGTTLETNGDNSVIGFMVENPNSIMAFGNLKGSNAILPATHTHAISEVTNLDTTLAGKANTVHTHVEANITDLDKYTKAEVTTALAGKANTVHTHVEANITDLDKYTKAEVDAKIIDPTVSNDGASFTVSVADGFDHCYSVSYVSVAVTIPTGLPLGHRFSVICKADTTFISTGNILNIPTGKQALPFGDNAMIGFIVVPNSIAIFGDLKDV